MADLFTVDSVIKLLTIEQDVKNRDECQKKLEYNVTAIWGRAQGQKFKEVEGKLETLTWWERVKYRINPWYRSSVQAKVQVVMTATLKAIDSIKIKKSERGAFCETFFNKVSRLSQKVFNRETAITDLMDSYLTDYIGAPQNDLCSKAETNSCQPLSYHLQEAKLAREQEQKRSRNSTISNAQAAKEEEKFRLTDMRAVKLAIRLGIELQLIKGGTSGVYLGRDRFNKERVVIKPADEGPYAANNPKWKTWFKRFFQKTFSCLGCTRQRDSLYAEGEYRAEVFASILNQFLKATHAHLQKEMKENTNKAESSWNVIVPVTAVEEFTSQAFYGVHKTKVVSCQKWEGGGKEAAEEAPTSMWWYDLYHKKGYDHVTINKTAFEQFAIFDYLTGNQDRHPENWQVKDGKEVIAFDHGLAFPIQHPEGSMALRKHTLWAKLKNADEPFSDAGKRLIEWIYKNPNELIGHLQAIKDTNNNDLFRPTQEHTLRDRIKALYNMSRLEESKIKDLYKVRSAEEISKNITPS